MHEKKSEKLVDHASIVLDAVAVCDAHVVLANHTGIELYVVYAQAFPIMNSPAG